MDQFELIIDEIFQVMVCIMEELNIVNFKIRMFSMLNLRQGEKSRSHWILGSDESAGICFFSPCGIQ
jgi:hypothetical protein